MYKISGLRLYSSVEVSQLFQSTTNFLEAPLALRGIGSPLGRVFLWNGSFFDLCDPSGVEDPLFEFYRYEV